MHLAILGPYTCKLVLGSVKDINKMLAILFHEYFGYFQKPQKEWELETLTLIKQEETETVNHKVCRRASNAANTEQWYVWRATERDAYFHKCQKEPAKKISSKWGDIPRGTKKLLFHTNEIKVPEWAVRMTADLIWFQRRRGKRGKKESHR
jgi:hypothetical protein